MATAAPPAPPAVEKRRSARPHVAHETVWTVVMAAVGFVAGVSALNDNSFFTHLTTGRGIVDTFSVPRSDPYTFTSAGEPWVVQSWLASALYGVLDAVGGAGALRLFTAAVSGGLAALVWRLSRPAHSLLPRLLLSGGSVLIGIVVWSERPLLLGLLFFALVASMIDEERIDARWAVPLFWVWANVHGSFPLGIVLLGTVLVGRFLDDRGPALRRSGSEKSRYTRHLTTRTDRLVRLTVWSVVGAVAGGVVNPYGPKLLWFPVDLLSKREQLQHVVEWQRPDLADRYAQIFLVVALLAVVAAVRSRRWDVIVPVVVFGIAAALGARNVAVASIAYCAVAAPGLEGLGSVTTDGRGRRARPLVLAVVAVTAVLSTLLLSGDHFALKAYPVEAVEWIDANDGFADGVRWAHTDTSGNYLTIRFDGQVPIFIDDRMELHAAELIDDYLVLNGGEAGWEQILDRYQIDAVLWPTDRPLAAALAASAEWHVVDWYRHTDRETAGVIACRPSTDLCERLAGAEPAVVNSVS